MKIVPFPICLDTQDVDEIVAAVKAVAPVFAGITDIVVSDVHGVAHGAREDIVRDGAENLVLLSERTNKRGVTGTLRQAIAGADVFIGVSAPDLLTGYDSVFNPDVAKVVAAAVRVAAVSPQTISV